MTKPQPSAHRIMSSRALGQDTEKTRQSLEAIDLEGDYVAAIKGKKCPENEELLKRSAIAFSSSSQSSEIILNHILSEGVNCIQIHPMGGMLHLVTFDSFEDKKSFMESGWLHRWFEKLINVNDESASVWRETWISVYGIPLIGWGYDNFFSIGCIFGRVISVDYKGFDRANILIFTDCLVEINCKVSMEINGKNYPVFISEKRQIWEKTAPPDIPLNVPSPWQPSVDSPSSEKLSDPMKTNSHTTQTIPTPNINSDLGNNICQVTEQTFNHCPVKSPKIKKANLKPRKTIHQLSKKSAPLNPNFSPSQSSKTIKPIKSPPSIKSKSKIKKTPTMIAHVYLPACHPII